MTALIDREQVATVYQRIQPYVRVTPIVEVNGADFGLEPFPLTLKLELLQHAGSFKTRGAFANLLTREIPPAGVVAASGGNHGAAVAYAAMRLGVPAKIFVPAISSPAKIARIRELRRRPRRSAATAMPRRWRRASVDRRRAGALPVHAFDQARPCSARARSALELERAGARPRHGAGRRSAAAG